MANTSHQTSRSVTAIFDGTLQQALPGLPLNKEYEQITLPGCELLSVLGHGGMGVVFLGREEATGELIAVKMLPATFLRDGLLQQRMEREARTLAKLDHANVVGCHGLRRTGEGMFLLMEYVPGRLSVRDLLERHGMQSEAIACRILLDAALGLAYANEKHVIHRDVKPDNLLIFCGPEERTDEPEVLFARRSTRVMIADFGIAKGMEAMDSRDELTREGNVIGSPAYMAPEQAEGNRRLDFRADIYGLGATLYHLLAGRPPFGRSGASPIAVLREKLTQGMPDPRDHGAEISDACATMFARMTAERRQERYETYTELIEDLARFAGQFAPSDGLDAHRAAQVYTENAAPLDAEQTTASAPPPAPEPEPEPFPAGMRLKVILALLSAIIVILAGLLWLGT